MGIWIYLLFLLLALIGGKGDKLLFLLSLASRHCNRRQLTNKTLLVDDMMIYDNLRWEKAMMFDGWRWGRATTKGKKKALGKKAEGGGNGWMGGMGTPHRLC
jgi:hypothetical protein